MPAVSQALLEFAKHHRTEGARGVEVTVTPRYQITLQPDLPIPGHNSISWIRCRPDEVDEVIREGRAAFAPHQQGFMWLLDPETEPSDFGDCLDRYGVHRDGDEVAVMVLPIDATVEAQEVAGLELVDGLATPESFRSADSANAEAFESPSRADDHERIAMLERRRLDNLAAGNRRLLLATMDGEPAGSAGLTVFSPSAPLPNRRPAPPTFPVPGPFPPPVASPPASP